MREQLRDADAHLFRSWLAEASNRDEETGLQVFSQEGEYALNSNYPLLAGAYWVVEWIGEMLHDYSYDLANFQN